MAVAAAAPAQAEAAQAGPSQFSASGGDGLAAWWQLDDGLPDDGGRYLHGAGVLCPASLAASRAARGAVHAAAGLAWAEGAGEVARLLRAAQGAADAAIAILTGELSTSSKAKQHKRRGGRSRAQRAPQPQLRPETADVPGGSDATSQPGEFLTDDPMEFSTGGARRAPPVGQAPAHMNLDEEEEHKEAKEETAVETASAATQTCGPSTSTVGVAAIAPTVSRGVQPSSDGPDDGTAPPADEEAAKTGPVAARTPERAAKQVLFPETPATPDTPSAVSTAASSGRLSPATPLAPARSKRHAKSLSVAARSTAQWTSRPHSLDEQKEWTAKQSEGFIMMDNSTGDPKGVCPRCEAFMGTGPVCMRILLNGKVDVLACCEKCCRLLT